MLLPVSDAKRLRPFLLGLGLVGSLVAGRSLAVEAKSVLTPPVGKTAVAPVKPEAAASKKGAEKTDAVAATKADAEAVVDFTGAARVDPIPALGAGADDFQDIEQRAARYALEGQLESEDARIERELKEYKDAEAKLEAERAREEAKAREAARLNAREEAAKESSRNRQTETEAQKKAAALKGIGTDELNWKGLED